MHWQRMFLHPMLKAFDAPTREECTAQRPQSNTPLASLILLNDPTFVEAARVFAEKIIKEGGEKFDSKVAYAFGKSVNRKPTLRELSVLSKLYAATVKDARSNPKQMALLNKNGIAKIDSKVDDVELAGWNAVARVLLNMSETNFRY